MKYRAFGSTGLQASEVSFGAWAIGGTWGPVNDAESMKTLHRALDLGTVFFDTADVYGDGHSEQLLARLRRERSDPFWVGTKVGRRDSPHTKSSYTPEKLRAGVERCLAKLEVEALDLLQLHCPPTDVYYMPEVFEAVDDLTRAGKVRFYGISVERVEEALKAIEYPNVKSVQIVFNLFRQRPADLFLDEARRRNVGVIARLPLSSGMLTGKLTRETRFDQDDHRAFNREGAAFDRGETFSGVDYELGLSVVEELRPLVPPGATLGQLAIAWILSHDAITCTIPGARRPAQLEQNVAAADLLPLAPETLGKLRAIYAERLSSHVHHRW